MKNLVAGVHIGDTLTRCALVDEFGKIYAYQEFNTKDYPKFDGFTVALRDKIKELSASLKEPNIVEAVGVGSPNGNHYTGEIENASNLPWKGKLQLVKQLGMLFGNTPIVLTNDANAAAIGEMMYGVAKNIKNFAVITLGTGVGSGLVVNGHILYGNDGFAGELGHCTVVRENGRACKCGKIGCLEGYTSTIGLKRTVFSLMSKTMYPSILRDMSYNQITTQEIAKLAKEGDEIALKAFETAGEYLGLALADLVAITTPEKIFLCGGLANYGEFILPSTKESFDKSLLPLWRDKIEIAISSLDAKRALTLGAAAHALREITRKSSTFVRRRVI